MVVLIQEVLREPAKAAIFLVLAVRPGSEDTARALLEDVAGLTRAVGFRAPDDLLSCVVGIGASAWSRLYRAPAPRELHPFRALSGAKHTAPATPGDLLFHLRARRMDLCFELAAPADGAAAPAASRWLDEVHGFKYFDERDLLGFVDGTENPTGPDAVAAVLIGDEDPAFAGGSYVIVQKYLHDLDAWNALPVEEQERVIGRTKLDDIELADDVKPANSHVALNTIVDPDGTERQIVRDNMPFGSGRGRRVRHVLHRVRRHAGRDRADAAAHVRRQPAREQRPDPRLLHRGHRHACSSCRPRTSSTIPSPAPPRPRPPDAQSPRTDRSVDRQPEKEIAHR